MALLGLIVLLGIVVNNGIILLDRIAILQNRHGYRWQRAVIVAGQSRVRPILMTSVTTMLGLFPLSLKQGTEFELWPPFAITVLGGLFVSSFATLIFVPVLFVGLEQTKAWLRRIGWPGITFASTVAAALLYWYHNSYQSILWTSIFTLPLWLSFLGVVYGLKQYLSVRKEKQQLSAQRLTISIKNLTKIYGAPGRFTREYAKQKRRWQKVIAAGRLPWDDRGLRENMIWMTAIAVLLVYLHQFLQNGFWLTILSILTLAWLFAARELWYRWRIFHGKPANARLPAWLTGPANWIMKYLLARPAKWILKNLLTRPGKWIVNYLLFGWLYRRLFKGTQQKPLPTQKDSGQQAAIWQRDDRKSSQPGGSADGTGSRAEVRSGDDAGSLPRVQNAGILQFQRKGSIFLVLLFLGYLQIRVGSPGLLIPVVVILLLIAWFRQIADKIVRGEIDPEQPAGRLRKIKRGLYTVTRTIPFIRPPKQKVIALHGVNLDIGQGMFGLLGPNGAGKTTLMRILVGVLEEDRGSIMINDKKLSEHRETFHGSIGYLPQDFGLYENMTPMEFLNYHAMTNGMYEPEKRQQLIDRIIESVGLWERRNDKIKGFSGGMKQRVGIAQTLLHLPQIIVVDEPTAGLDPRERIRFRNLLSELAKDRIVVFSTHIVEDISSTCHDLAVLDQGQLIYRGSPEEMQRRAAGKIYECAVDENELVEMQKAVQVIQHSKSNGGIRVRFMSEEPVDISDAFTVEPTLEDAYVYLLKGSQEK
jgi:ABC-type multidrug transport system ATPase subunit